MLTEPTIVEKTEQPYAAIVITVTQPEVAEKAPPLIGDVFGWLAEHGGEEAGPVFFNYVNFLPGGRMQMQVGVPTKTQLQGDGRVVTGTLPGGRYVSATLEGPYSELYHANMTVDQWGRDKGHQFAGEQKSDSLIGATRLEIYHSDPDAEPPVTEVAFLLK